MAVTSANSPSSCPTGRWPTSPPWARCHWGKGLGTAAQRLLAEYLFATTLANRLQAITDVENLPEQRALEGAGFRREGIMRGLTFDRGRWHDGVLYARLREDITGPGD